MYLDNLAAWATLVVNLAGLLTPADVPERGVRVRIETGLNQGGGGQIPTIKVKLAGDQTDGELMPSMLRRTRKKPNNRDTVDGGPRGLDIATSSNLDIRALDIRMEAYRNGHRGPLVSLNDEMCLTSLVWTPRDTRPNYDNRRGAITGDLMYFCKYSWYYSGKVFEGRDLRCGWLDGDNSNGNLVKGLYLDLDKFGKNSVENHARDHPSESDFCTNGVRFYPGNQPLRKRFITDDSNINSTADPAKTLTPKESFGNKAFVSTRVSAIELCDHPTSYGPSMLNVNERMFCDMTSKTKVPMCDSNRIEGCMDYSRLQKRDGIALSRSLAAKNVPATPYPAFQLDYFTLTDENNAVIDNGSDI
ncbi:hypothetical protein BGZ68_001032 [Mortierella alpina]|nr:hypothetical protein BGZ68_001032 [Mortierella alpina]